jgi:uncharacterized SAM-binding protein YcdF (DUF218 family)
MQLKKLSKFFIFIIFLLSIFYYFILNLGYIFDVTEKAVKSDLILCLGGGEKERLKKTIELYKLNYSKNILLTATNTNTINKELSLLHKENIDENYILFQDKLLNTYDELYFTKELMLKNSYKSVLIISDEPHSLRIKLLIQTFIKFEKDNISYKIVGSNPKWWNKKEFYKNKRAIYFVTRESFKIPFNLIFYTLDKYFIFDLETLETLENYKKDFATNLNKTITYFLK